MISVSFSGVELNNARWHRRKLLRLFTFVAAVSRFIWSHSSDAHSTFYQTGRLWNWTWMINRYIGCLPRKEPTRLKVDFNDIVLDLDLSRLIDSFALCFGLGESEIGYLFSHVCKQNSVVLDIGANIGTTALFFAAKCINGKVHAYEPSKNMLQILENNIEHNHFNNIVIHPYALSDKTGTAWLKEEMQNNPGSAHLSNVAEGCTVEINTLDETPPIIDQLDFVKIDVEGYELQVLKGGERLFQLYRPALVFEINSSAIERMRITVADIYQLLGGWGYKLFILEKGRLVEFVSVLGSISVFNVIAIHSEKLQTVNALMKK